jgi:hypothetical protein
MMLEALVALGDKFFCADDARFGKVSCTVPETIDLVYFEIFPSFLPSFLPSFFLNCLFSYLAAAFLAA